MKHLSLVLGIFSILNGCGELNQPSSYYRVIGSIGTDNVADITKNANIIKTIIITSQGGDTEAAIAIGRIIRANNISVEVKKYCLSACAQYILPAAPKIVLIGNSVIAVHHSPISIKNILLESGDTVGARDYIDLARLESDYFDFLGIDKFFLSQMFNSLEPICIAKPSDSRKLTGIKYQYMFYIPNKSQYEKWIKTTVQGSWPKSEEDFIKYFADSIPKGVNTSFVINQKKEKMEKLKFCD